MAELSIPKEHQPKFIYFVQLSDDIKAEIFNALTNSKTNLNPRILTNSIHEDINGLDKKSIFNIVEIFLNLINTKNSIDTSLKEFMGLLSEALKETENQELIPNEKMLSDFEKLLLSGNNIADKAKILDLMTENSRIFLDAKIYQDIRTSFDKKGNVVGSTIIHNLKLVTKESRKLNDFYISLDTNDLETLSKEIKKAQENVKLIKKSFDNAKIIEPS